MEGSQEAVSTSSEPISSLYAALIDVFRKVIFSLGKHDCQPVLLGQIQPSDFLDQFARLKIWGDQSGATRPWQSRGSLDDRLRKDVDLKLTVIDLLRLLQTTLQRCDHLLSKPSNDQSVTHTRSRITSTPVHSGRAIRSAHTEHSPSTTLPEDVELDPSSESDASSCEDSNQPRRTTAQYLLNYVAEHIKSLFRLSTLLRRPEVVDKFLASTTRKASEAVYNLVLLPDYGHIYEKIRQWHGYRGVSSEGELGVSAETLEQRRMQPSTAFDEFSVLVRRLGRANFRRREQLQYWARNPDKVSREQEPSQEHTLDQPQILTSLNRAEATQNNPNVSEPIPPSEVFSRPKSEQLTLNFSAVARSAVYETASTNKRPRTEYAISEFASGSHSLRVPDLPLGPLNGVLFQCPFCFTDLNYVTMQDRNTWKRHVFRDLRPYVCTYEDCQDPDKMYVTRNDWIYHETQMHRRRWVCAPPCNYSCDSRERFRQHLASQHDALLTTQQIGILLEMRERPMDEIVTCDCPLCPESMPYRQLHRHVAGHLENIALFSLHQAIPDGETDSNEAAQPHQRSSFDDLSNEVLDQDYENESIPLQQHVSSSTYDSPRRGVQDISNRPSQQSESTPAMRGSSIFSSAMPTSDASDPSHPVSPPLQASDEQEEYKLLFLAASMYEFNIDSARKEAGYPYLSYVPGEVFEVIALKGELWLAKNQDDPTNTLGWIWDKHFAKLVDQES